MNVALRKAMSLAEFLDWEERQPAKYEFDGFAPVAMVGVSVAHSTIQTNLLAALSVRLRGKACRPHGSDLKIEVAGRIRYPDVFVVCSPQAPDAKVVGDPVIVFEILSASTRRTDLFLKPAEYRATASVAAYVILEQTGPAAQVFMRRGEDWGVATLSGRDAVLKLPEIDVEIPFEEIYADVPDTEPEDQLER